MKLVTNTSSYLLAAAALAAPRLASAQEDLDQCADITQDPFVDLSGPGTGVGHSNLEFDRYCGTGSTPTFGAAIESNPNRANTKESNCRIKCKNWPIEEDDEGNKNVKLFWVRTKTRWLRAKYLKCMCRVNNQDEKVCKYKRRGYNFKEQAGRTTGEDDEDENSIQVACEEPGCTHPNDVTEFNDGAVSELRDKDDNVVCTDCNLNNGRGGTWQCYDAEGGLISSSSPVPRKGYCQLKCGYQDSFNIERKMKCQWPHKLNGVDQYKFAFRIYSHMIKKKFKKVMDEEIGWKCSAEFSDEAIQSALNEATGGDDDEDEDDEEEDEEENEEEEEEEE